MFCSEFETPGFHQKADVLEEIKEVQTSFIEEKKNFFFKKTQFNWKLGFRIDNKFEGCWVQWDRGIGFI